MSTVLVGFGVGGTAGTPPCLAAALSSVSPLLCVVGMIHVLTLIGAWFARTSSGSRYERPCQAACFGLLAVTGALCGVSLHLGPGMAVSSAVTLALATLIAVADFGDAASPDRRPDGTV